MGVRAPIVAEPVCSYGGPSVPPSPLQAGIDIQSIRLRRSARGAHLKGEDSSAIGEGGCGLTDGSAVFVEEGAPLGKGDVLVKAYVCEPTYGRGGGGAPASAPAGT